MTALGTSKLNLADKLIRLIITPSLHLVAFPRDSPIFRKLIFHCNLLENLRCSGKRGTAIQAAEAALPRIHVSTSLGITRSCFRDSFKTKSALSAQYHILYNQRRFPHHKMISHTQLPGRTTRQRRLSHHLESSSQQFKHVESSGYPEDRGDPR